MHNDRHDDLEDRLNLIVAAENCNTALKEACGILHKIAGTAGTLGLSELGDAALKAESVIQNYTNANFTDRRPVIAELNRFLELSITFCNRRD